MVLVQQDISLQLNTMQVNATPTPKGRCETPTRPELRSQPVVVHPGEPAHVVLDIKNWTSIPQQLSLQLTGTFPAHWCALRSHQDASSSDDRDSLPTLEVPAKQTGHVDLWFEVPPQFFEAASESTEQPLNFQGCLAVYGQRSPGQSPIQQLEFALTVRPHSHYISFLPAVYQEVEFIHRLITLFEQAFDPVVNSYMSMWAYLDPLTAPASLLPFLAHWVDWPLETQLGLTQQRRLLRRAVQLYRWRGTRQGLRFYLHLYTGLPLDDHLPEAEKSISITEPFSQGCLLGLAHMGQDAILGGGQAYHFQVRLRCPAGQAMDEDLVRRILDQEKPAFCTYTLLLESTHARHQPEESF